MVNERHRVYLAPVSDRLYTVVGRWRFRSVADSYLIPDLTPDFHSPVLTTQNPPHPSPTQGLLGSVLIYCFNGSRLFLYRQAANNSPEALRKKTTLLPVGHIYTAANNRAASRGVLPAGSYDKVVRYLRQNITDLQQRSRVSLYWNSLVKIMPSAVYYKLTHNWPKNKTVDFRICRTRHCGTL